MKHLKKIIALFLFIFITGIFIAVVSINKTLDKPTKNLTVKAKDSVYLLKKGV